MSFENPVQTLDWFLGLMWQVTCRGTSILAHEIKIEKDKNEPVVWFDHEDRKFSIEFKCKTDYNGAANGHNTLCIVINNNRSVRLPAMVRKVPQK